MKNKWKALHNYKSSSASVTIQNNSQAWLWRHISVTIDDSVYSIWKCWRLYMVEIFHTVFHLTLLQMPYVVMKIHKDIDTYTTTNLADLNGWRCARESWQTRLEGWHFAEWTSTTGVDSSNSELVGGAWQELLSLQNWMVWHWHHIDILQIWNRLKFGRVTSNHKSFSHTQSSKQANTFCHSLIHQYHIVI